MKLDNRGWGLNFLLVVGAIFLIILVFVSIKIRSLTHQLSKDEQKKYSEKSKHDSSSVDSSLYFVLEKTLKDAGNTYVIYHSTLVENTSDHLIVWYKTLKDEGYVTSLDDPEGENECNGYVMIKNNGDVNSFVKCQNYETTNYKLWVDNYEE